MFSFFYFVATYISAVNEGIAGRIQLGDESVFSTADRGLYLRQRGECRGRSPPGDVRVARGVDRNSKSAIITAASQVSAIDQSVAAGTEFGHKRVHAAAILRTQRVDGGQVGGNGPSGEIGVAGAIDGNGGDSVHAAPAYVRAVREHGINDQRNHGIENAQVEANGAIGQQSK